MLPKQIDFKIKSRFFIDNVSTSDIDIHARKKMVIDDRRSKNIPYKHNKQSHNSTTINHHNDYNDNDLQNMNMSLPMNITQGTYQYCKFGTIISIFLLYTPIIYDQRAISFFSSARI